MALGKLVKGGSLVLAGALVGGLLSYSSKKTEIVAGIDDIANTAIEYKTQAKELSTSKKDLEKKVADLTASLESAQETVRNLTKTKTELENKKAALEAQIEKLTAEKDADKAEINRLNEMIAFKDMLLQTTYEEAMRLEDEVENLTKQLEEAKKNSNNIVDKANEEIKKANQDQVEILNAVKQAKEKINNN